MIIGLILSLLNSRFENNAFSPILEKHKLFHWGGLLVLVFNILKKRKLKNKNQTQSDS